MSIEVVHRIVSFTVNHLSFETEVRSVLFQKDNILQHLWNSGLKVPPSTVFKPRLEPSILVTILI
jgi:hypothetical protein